MNVLDVGYIVYDFTDLHVELVFQVIEIPFRSHARFRMGYAADVMLAYDDDGSQYCVDLIFFLAVAVQ